MIFNELKRISIDTIMEIDSRVKRDSDVDFIEGFVAEKRRGVYLIYYNVVDVVPLSYTQTATLNLATIELDFRKGARANFQESFIYDFIMLLRRRLREDDTIFGKQIQADARVGHIVWQEIIDLDLNEFPSPESEFKVHIPVLMTQGSESYWNSVEITKITNRIVFEEDRLSKLEATKQGEEDSLKALKAQRAVETDPAEQMKLDGVISGINTRIMELDNQISTIEAEIMRLEGELKNLEE